MGKDVSAQGTPHMDRLNARGHQISKRWLLLSNNDALNLPIDDISANWERYLIEFEGR